MKKYIVICALLPVVYLGQVTADILPAPKSRIEHEIGLNVYELDFKRMDYRFETDAHPFRHHFANGLYYRLFKGQHGLRTGGKYYQHEKSQDFMFYPGFSYVYYPPIESSLYRAVELHVGYQFRFSRKKFTPYVLADLSGRYSREQFFECHNCYYIAIAPTVKPRETIIAGISPGIGIRYTPVRHLVLTAETQLQYYLSESQFLDFNSDRVRDFGVSMQPVQVSVGFSF